MDFTIEENVKSTLDLAKKGSTKGVKKKIRSKKFKKVEDLFNNECNVAYDVVMDQMGCHEAGLSGNKTGLQLVVCSSQAVMLNSNKAQSNLGFSEDLTVGRSNFKPSYFSILRRPFSHMQYGKSSAKPKIDDGEESQFSGGLVLCCNSTTDSEVVQGNNRFVEDHN